MVRRTEHKESNLFRRQHIRELSAEGVEYSGKRSLKGVNYLHMGVSLLMAALGLFSVFLVVMGYIRILWMSSLLLLLGSVNVMVGAWLLYETVNERKSIDNLVKKAVKRAISEKN